MENNTFMEKLRSFIGLRQEPPRNDFRNPIWGSDDEDDDDELYARQKVTIYTNPADFQQEFANQMQDMFKSFGSIFEDMRSLFHEEHFDTVGTNTIDGHDSDSVPENFHGGSIRDYYLKPGIKTPTYQQPKEDIDLDGKISSQEISGLLKQKEEDHSGHIPFNGNMVPGRSFCQTIITTSVKKPDGSVETRRIIKNGHDVVEETTTTSGPDAPSPFSHNMDSLANSSIIYNHVMSELSTLFKNLH